MRRPARMLFGGLVAFVSLMAGSLVGLIAGDQP
jgi:hypothetical protein